MPETTNEIQKFSLNLNPRYAPSWGAWEIAREFICNAKDAAPDECKIETPTAGRLTVWTPTVPSLAEMFMIGAGTKAPGDSTIGQFGEGAKLAALAATRQVGWDVEIETPEHLITFGLEKSLGEDCLHAYITPVAVSKPGMTISVRADGIASKIMGKFIFGEPEGPMPKSDPHKMQLYVKGVWISAVEFKSIYDWNLTNVALNRDRTMATRHEIGWTIRMWLFENMTFDIAMEIVRAEGEMIEHYGLDSVDGRAATVLLNAFMEEHGSKAVAATTDHDANQEAQSLGFTLVSGIEDSLAKCLRRAGLKTSGDVIPEKHPVAVDSAPYSGAIDWLREFEEIVGMPSIPVSVMRNDDVRLQGLADLQENRLWLNESLFEIGNEFELARTYLHELAHFATRGADATRTFEQGLDYVAAKLAMRIKGQL